MDDSAAAAPETVRAYLDRVVGEAVATAALEAGHVRIGEDDYVDDPERVLQPGERPLLVPW